MQAYAVRMLVENKNEISFAELNSYFPYFNDQVLKKATKEIGIEVDRNQICSLEGLEQNGEELLRRLISPENVCNMSN